MNTGLSSKIMRIIAIAGLGITLATGTSDAAETWSGWGSITYIEAGWVEDTIAVYHTAPTVNPDNCPVINAGYATNPNDRGHGLFHTVALGAFLNKKEVHLLISGCVYGKPRIIAIGTR